MPPELRNAALQVYNNRKKSLLNTNLTLTSLRSFPDEAVQIETNEAVANDFSIQHSNEEVLILY